MTNGTLDRGWDFVAPQMAEDYPKIRTAEHRLICAVIERSVLDFDGFMKARWLDPDLRDADTAFDWIFSDYDPTGSTPFSFLWCCRQIGIDPTWFRERMAARLAKGKTGVYNHKKRKNTKNTNFTE